MSSLAGLGHQLFAALQALQLNCAALRCAAMQAQAPEHRAHSLLNPFGPTLANGQLTYLCNTRK